MTARGEFRNEAYTDFTRPENRAAMEAALQAVRSRFGKRYDLLIDGQWVASDKTFTSINPSNKDQVLGLISKGSREQADQAVRVAARAFESWRRVPAAERSEFLFRAADELRKR